MFLIAVNMKCDDRKQETLLESELEPVEKWSTGPVRPVGKFYRSGPVGNRPVGIICPTGEIPAKPVKNRPKMVKIFWKNNFYKKSPQI
jgi:hypothetical protein